MKPLVRIRVASLGSHRADDDPERGIAKCLNPSNMSKERRLASLFGSQTHRTMIVPLDHGVHDGPIRGIENLPLTVSKLAGICDAVVLHKGCVKHCQRALGQTPFILHLSASTSLGVVLRKVLVAEPSEALDLGAAGVSIHVNMGNEFEPEMLSDLGHVAGQCGRLGLPLLAMMYIRQMHRGKVLNFTDTVRVKHAVRVASELGADIVKAPYTGSSVSFAEVVEGVNTPVVIAGGTVNPKGPPILQVIRDAIRAGASGVSMGRYVFQNANMTSMAKSVRSAVHERHDTFQSFRQEQPQEVA